MPCDKSTATPFLKFFDFFCSDLSSIEGLAIPQRKKTNKCFALFRINVSYLAGATSLSCGAP
jgi:hypothetical protein